MSYSDFIRSNTNQGCRMIYQSRSTEKQITHQLRERDRDLIIAYIKDKGEAVPTADVCRDLNLKPSIPGFVARRFKSTLHTWKSHSKGKVYIDIDPHTWAWHRAGLA